MNSVAAQGDRPPTATPPPPPPLPRGPPGFEERPDADTSDVLRNGGMNVL